MMEPDGQAEDAEEESKAPSQKSTLKALSNYFGSEPA